MLPAEKKIDVIEINRQLLFVYFELLKFGNDVNVGHSTHSQVSQ